jgi:hypothetical protein
LDAQRRFSEAGETLKEAVSIGRKMFGNDNPELAVYLVFLAASLRKSGSLREAEAAAREALAIDAKHLGGDHSELGKQREPWLWRSRHNADGTKRTRC